MLANALVVLCLGQNLIVLAVGKHKHRALDAAEELLDNHLCRGVSEHAVEHLLQFLLSLLESGEYQHTLAGAQTVSLQHIRSLQRL